MLSSSSCLLALSRVVLRSLTFPVPLDAFAERDCVFGAAIAIVPSGSRRFVLVVVVATTVTVMSGGVHAGLLWLGINTGVAKQAPPFWCQLIALWCPVLQSNTPVKKGFPEKQQARFPCGYECRTRNNPPKQLIESDTGLSNQTVC